MNVVTNTLHVIYGREAYCYFDGFIGYNIAAIQFMPLIISIAQTGVSMYTGEPVFAIFGHYLSIAGWLMYFIQKLFKSPVLNPRCLPSFIVSYGFPCEQVVYVFAVVGATLGYYYMWGPYWPRAYVHLLLFVAAVGMPTILLVLQLYSLAQIGGSILLSIIITIGFLLLLRYVITPNLHKILRSKIIRFLVGYKQDTYLMTTYQIHLLQKVIDEQERPKSTKKKCDQYVTHTRKQNLCPQSNLIHPGKSLIGDQVLSVQLEV